MRRLSLMLALTVLILPQGRAKTAMQFLEEAPKFGPRHTLLLLTRWGWEMPFDVMVELRERCGMVPTIGARTDSPALNVPQ